MHPSKPLSDRSTFTFDHFVCGGVMQKQPQQQQHANERAVKRTVTFGNTGMI